MLRLIIPKVNWVGGIRSPEVSFFPQAYSQFTLLTEVIKFADQPEAIIAAITSQTERVLIGDHLIRDWRGAGLLFPSVATGIIRTIKQGMIAQ